MDRIKDIRKKIEEESHKDIEIDEESDFPVHERFTKRKNIRH